MVLKNTFIYIFFALDMRLVIQLLPGVVQEQLEDTQAVRGELVVLRLEVGHDDDMRHLEHLLHGLVLGRKQHAVLQLLHDLIVARVLLLAGVVKEHDGLAIVGMRNVSSLAASVEKHETGLGGNEVPDEIALAVIAILIVDPKDLAGMGLLSKEIKKLLLPGIRVVQGSRRKVLARAPSHKLVHKVAVPSVQARERVHDVLLGLGSAGQNEVLEVLDVSPLARLRRGPSAELPRAILAGVGLHAVVARLLRSTLPLLQVSGSMDVTLHLLHRDRLTELYVALVVGSLAFFAALELPDDVLRRRVPVSGSEVRVGVVPGEAPGADARTGRGGHGFSGVDGAKEGRPFAGQG